MRRARRSALLVALLSFSLVVPRAALAKSPVKLTKFEGAIDLEADGPMAFTLTGTASHLGKFTSYGEVEFVPSEKMGSVVGAGPVVFRAANGDLLVGVVTWELNAGTGEFRTAHMHIGWRDAVEFSDGTVVTNTGRFVEDRPPGLVVFAIIAVLIGTFLPGRPG
jgi:hypothetical protein